MRFRCWQMNCDVQNMSSIDYRLVSASNEERTFFSSTDCDSKFEMDRRYEELVSREVSAEEGPQTVEVLGRKIRFEKTCGDILDTTFHQLCAQALGAADYIAICRYGAFSVMNRRSVDELCIHLSWV